MVVDREVTMNESPTAPPSAPPPDAAPSPKGLGPWRAVGIFAAFLGIQALVTAPAAFWAGIHAGAGAHLDPSLLMFLGLVSTVWGGFVVLWMARRSLPGVALARIGWAPASARACGRAALQGLGLVAAAGVVGAFLPPPRGGMSPLDHLSELTPLAGLAGALLAVVAAPMVEELLFRGVVYTGLARRWSPGVAGTVTTLVFLALHLPQVGAYWPGWIFIGLVGALALRARLTSGSLLPAIAQHATYNLGLVLAVAAAAAARS
jgi:membrane protease YdiL (CAAX protease family)